jgi:hypothetical protein
VTGPTRIAVGLATGAALWLAGPGPAAAQGWSVEAEIGRLQYEAGPLSGESSLRLGLGYFDPRTGFRLSAGFPFGEDERAWAAAEGQRRLALEPGRFTLGLDLGAGFFGQTSDGGVDQSHGPPVGGGLLGPGRPQLQPSESPAQSGFAASGEALAVAGWSRPDLRMEIRSGPARYHGRFGEATLERSIWTSDATFSVSPRRGLLLNARARHVAAEEGNHPFAGVTGVLANDRWSGWASAGRWFSGHLEDNVSWGAGLAFRPIERAGISAHVRHDPFDPLFLSPGRTSIGVGVQLRLSAPSPAATPPVPAAYQGGRATIRLRASDAPESPRIAGDFNGWTPEPMTRDGRYWSYTIPLAPGVYRYAFVAPDGEWFVPESVPGRRADDFGGHVAVLVVE